MKDGTSQPEETLHDRQVELEARMQLKFSPEQALLHAGGGGLLKGGNPLAPSQQAEYHLLHFLDQNLRDNVMEKAVVQWVSLHRKQMDEHPEKPIQGLQSLLEWTLVQDAALVEFVRIVDVVYGEIMQENPRFQKPGEAPHPDDPYTHASVRQTLRHLTEATRTALGVNE